MKAPRPSCVPFIATIAENSRIHTKQSLRRALIAMGYPMPNEDNDSEYAVAYKWLRRHGWVTMYTGARSTLHCAPDVTSEEAIAYCKAHNLPVIGLTKQGSKRTKRAIEAGYAHAELAAVVRAISGSYARARLSRAWRAAA